MSATVDTVYEIYMKGRADRVSETSIFGKVFHLGFKGKPKPKWLHKTDLVYGAYKAGYERFESKEE